MKIIVNESQYKTILNEGLIDKISKELENLKRNTQKILSDMEKAYNFHIRFGLTYGAGIGAIFEPIMSFLSEKTPELTKYQIQMIALAAISIVFFENKDIKNLQKKIDEEGLENELAEAVSYTSSLKTKIKRILEVMGMTFYRATDIVSYAFLLPLLTEINKIINLDIQLINYEMISRAILSATGIMLSGLVIKRLVNKILK